MAKVRAVFLDRDGVLNHVRIRDGLPVGPVSLSEFRIVEGVADEVSRLKAAGFRIIVVTNQPEIARGRLSLKELEAMHRRLLNEVGVDAVYFCPHSDEDACRCRKPRPGLLLAAADDHEIDLPGSYMIGDRWRDVEAGRAAGCKTFFLDNGYNERVSAAANFVVRRLGAAVDKIIEASKHA